MRSKNLSSSSFLTISDVRNDAEDAIDALDGRKYDGRELSVQYARLYY